MKKRSQTLLEDTHVGPYKIIKKIGEGGMGTVYEAVEDLLGRRVALKFITREYEEKKEELLKRFYIEAKALAQVHHPNIVTIYSIGEFEGEPYIAMEYVQGKTLKEYLRKKGSFSLEEAIPIFLQLLKAVKALHDRGIIHRDLKPHNIIIQDDGTAKIVDFGIAKLSDNDVDVTRAGAVLGSVRYMSPEMATGKNATKQSDIRSLGIIFYEMLVGKSPYEAKEFHLLIQEVIKKDIRIPVSAYVKVPLEWRNLLNKMCERDRKKRYESIDDILLDFQSAYGLDISNSLSISLGMQKSLENISKRQNFRKYVALGVAFVVILLGGVGYYFLFIKPKNPVLVVLPPEVPEEQSGDGFGGDSLDLQNSSEDSLGSDQDKSSVVNHQNELERRTSSEEKDDSQKVQEPLEEEQQAERKVEKLKESLPQSKEKQAFERKEKPLSPSSKEPSPASRKVTQETSQKQDSLNLKEPETSHKNSISLSPPTIKKRKIVFELKFKKSPLLERGMASIEDLLPSSYPVLKWRGSRLSHKYLLQISEDRNFSSLLEERVVESTALSWKPPHPGRFYWRVKSLSSNGEESPFSPVVIMDVLLEPPVIEVASSQIELKSYNLKKLKQKKVEVKVYLEPPPLSSLAKLEVSRKKDFKKIVSTILGKGVLSLKIPSSGTYYLRAQAMDTQKRRLSSYSSAKVVKVKKVLELREPKLIGPKEGFVVRNSKSYVLFKWKKVRYAHYYLFQASQDPSFKDILLEKKLGTLKFFQKSPLPKGKIYWRVKALRRKYQSDWSEIRSLEVL